MDNLLQTDYGNSTTTKNIGYVQEKPGEYVKNNFIDVVL